MLSRSTECKRGTGADCRFGSIPLELGLQPCHDSREHRFRASVAEEVVRAADEHGIVEGIVSQTDLLVTVSKSLLANSLIQDRVAGGQGI